MMNSVIEEGGVVRTFLCHSVLNRVIQGPVGVALPLEENTSNTIYLNSFRNLADPKISQQI